MSYALRTMDIDFAVKLAISDRAEKVDLEKILTALGYIPVMMGSGIRRFSRENFTIEFVAHRKGGRDDEVISVRRWNITASPLPFINLLLDFPLIVDFGNFKIRTPLPEAFFLHKLITAQRRPGGGKKDKDLEQCSIIARQLDTHRLESIVKTLRLSNRTKRLIKASCGAIDFPPQKLGIK